jgi:hypothetical protein
MVGFIKTATRLGIDYSGANVKALIQGLKNWLRKAVGLTPAPSERVLRLAKKVTAVERGNAHFCAVQAQCAFAIETYAGVLQLASVQNGVGAVSLGRTLFEAVVSAIILAKHQEKLEDFKNHGKLTTFQMARSVPSGSRFDSPELRKFRDDTEVECNVLQAYFKPTSNLREIGTFSRTRMRLPRRSCQRTSGADTTSVCQLLRTVTHFRLSNNSIRKAKIGRSRRSMRNGRYGPRKKRVMGMLLMLHMIARLSSVFALGLESEIAPVWQQVWGIAQQRMQGALRPSG